MVGKGGGDGCACDVVVVVVHGWGRGWRKESVGCGFYGRDEPCATGDMVGAVVEHLGQCHRDGESLVLCPSTESSLLQRHAAPLPARSCSIGRPLQSRQG